MKKLITHLFFAAQVLSFGHIYAQCNNPLPDNTFSQIRNGVAAMPSGREQAIRDVTSSNCLSLQQIGDFAQLFASEQERLNYVQLAYSFSSDIQNYQNLNYLFNDSNVLQQFWVFIQNQKAAVANPLVTSPVAGNPVVNNPADNNQVSSHSSEAINTTPVAAGQNTNIQVNPSTDPNPTDAAPAPNPTPEPPAPVSLVEGYYGRIGCQNLLDERTFNTIYVVIQSESFDNKKTPLFKRLIEGKCLSVAQVHKISALYTFDNYRLEMLKIAFLNCYDLNNFYSLQDDFDFDSQKKDLANFIAANMERLTTMVIETPKTKEEKLHGPVPGYKGAIGCANLISKPDYENLMKISKAETFDNKRTALIRTTLGQKCLTCEQVKELATLYSFDNYKLEFAKYAYGRTYDSDNFIQLESMFSFDSHKKDLRKYIGSTK